MVIDSPSRHPGSQLGLAREQRKAQTASAPPFWDRIPEISTERRIALLRWVVPISLAAITFAFEIEEHWLDVTTRPLAFTDFSREALLFGVLWPLSAFLLLSWLLRQWRLRRDASSALHSLYVDMSKAHQELAILDQARQELLRRQVNAQEEERRRIAAEVHDELGSLLTRINTDLERLRMVHQHASAEFDAEIAQCRTLVGQTVDRAHDICMSLRPVLLERLGLRAALKEEACNRLSSAGIVWQLDVQGDPNLVAPETALVAFRIAQESISNVLRHAHATHVSIQLEQADQALHMRIRDNGIGLPAAERRCHTKALGLIGMCERAQAVGGSVEVRNAPNGGVEVSTQLPIGA